jgi:hypothetical protein
MHHGGVYMIRSVGTSVTLLTPSAHACMQAIRVIVSWLDANIQCNPQMHCHAYAYAVASLYCR